MSKHIFQTRFFFSSSKNCGACRVLKAGLSFEKRSYHVYGRVLSTVGLCLSRRSDLVKKMNNSGCSVQPDRCTLGNGNHGM